MARKSGGKSSSSSSRAPAGRKTAAKRSSGSSPKTSSRSAASKRSSAKTSSAKRAPAKKAAATSKRRTPTRAAAAGSKSAGRSAGGATKVGTSRRAAAAVGGKGDFGVRERRHTATNAGARAVREQQADERRVHGKRGRDLPRAGIDSRSAGVGGHEAGPGSYSGGDVDTTITGVGAGGSGLAQAGPDDVNDLREAESSGTSREFASGPPARGENQGRRRGRVGGSKEIRGGSTVDRSGGAATTHPDASGAVGYTRPDQTGAGAVDIKEMTGTSDHPELR